MDVQRLEKKIISASMKYYSGQSPMMSDEAFDGMVDQLKQLDPNHWLLRTPGWGYTPEKDKIKHIGKGAVGSLEKVQYPNVTEGMKKAMFTPKFDGMSVVLYWYQGDLKAVTRGDGVTGKDVTQNMLAILKSKVPYIFERLQEKHPNNMWACRGEVITDKRYEKVLKEDKGVIHLRNYAAGLINRDNVSYELNYLTFIPYTIRIDHGQEYLNQAEMIDELKNIGFEMCPFEVPEQDFDSEYLYSLYERWALTYPIDGLVYSNPGEDWITEDHDGDFSDFTNFCGAYKFPSETKQVTVDKVEWRTGSSGRCNPTVVLTEKTEISGAMVDRASAHHAQLVKDHCIGPNAVLEVKRANEVIPYIENVIESSDEFSLPNNCDVCETELEWDGVFLKCFNLECPARAYTALYRLFSVSGIPDGISDKTLEKWLENFPTKSGHQAKINNIFEFIKIFDQAGPKNIEARTEQLKQLFQPHFGDLLWQLEVNIENKLKEGFSFQEFWHLLNIPYLGPENSKKLSECDPRDLISGVEQAIDSEDTETVEAAYKKLEEKLLAYGVNVSVRKSICQNMRYWNDLSKILNLYKEDSPKGFLSGKNIVFTRVRLSGQDKKKFTEAGGVESSGVSKKTDLVVTDNPAGNTGKLKKARELGKPIVTVEQLMDMIEENE